MVLVKWGNSIQKIRCVNVAQQPNYATLNAMPI